MKEAGARGERREGRERREKEREREAMHWHAHVTNDLMTMMQMHSVTLAHA